MFNGLRSIVLSSAHDHRLSSSIVIEQGMAKVRASSDSQRHAESHQSSPVTCERATFLADRMPDVEQLGDSLVRVRLTRATGDDSSCEDFSVRPIQSSQPKAPTSVNNIADVNYKNLQQSIASLSSENAALRNQLSTLAALKAQGDSLEMQVASPTTRSAAHSHPPRSRR